MIKIINTNNIQLLIKITKILLCIPWESHGIHENNIIDNESNNEKLLIRIFYHILEELNEEQPNEILIHFHREDHCKFDAHFMKEKEENVHPSICWQEAILLL